MFELDNKKLLLLYLVLIAVVGTYFTYYKQGQRLSRLKEKVEQKQSKYKKLKKLGAKLASVKEGLKKARRKWQNRYKTTPDTLTSSEVGAYLTDVTDRGFPSIQINSPKRERRDGYGVQSFQVSGKTSFSRMYEAVWKLENSREFFRVRDLRLSYIRKEETTETGKKRMRMLVSFKMKVEAIYGIAPPIPEKQQREFRTREPSQLPKLKVADAEVPSGVMPRSEPASNPFYPVVMEKLPPNTEGYLNIENAQLLSVAGNSAMFRGKNGTVRLSEGDRVYLGRIVQVQPEAGKVVARLNRGGIIDRVTRNVWSDSKEERVLTARAR